MNYRIMGSLRPLVAVLILVLSVSLVDEVMCFPDTDVTTNCSSTGYPAVPCAAPANTVTLDLSHNYMERVPAGCFPHLQKLKRLLLQSNRISAVDPNAFQHNPVLEYLDISHNLLPQISALPFTSLPALAYLDISNNAYKDIIVDNSFDPRGNLRGLKLGSSHGITIRRDQVKRLGNLRLKEVHLVAGKVKEYEPGSLSALKNMDMLTLDTEYSDTATHLLILTDTCNNTKTLTVTKLDLTKTNIVFPVQDLLERSTFSRLIAKDWMIDGIYCKLMPYFLNSNIEELYVENLHGKDLCNFTIGTFTRCHLRIFSLNGIDNRDFMRFRPQLTIGKFMACLTDISAINISTRFFPCELSVALVNLKTLNLSINELLETRVLTDCQSPFPKLQSLAVDHNMFEHLGVLGNKTAHMKDLVNLTASYNTIHLEPQVIFINWTKSLRRLNLRGNQLTNEAFLFLPQTLEMLDISYNIIHTIPNLQRMNNLRELFLSGNKIMTLHNVLLPSSVRLLRVDRNNMSIVSEATIRSLNVTQLDFSGNPLHCDCDTLQLAQFCRDSSQTEILGWPSRYRCQSPDSLRNETLQQLSLPWPSCHKGLCALIMICCICLPIICYLLFKKLHGQIPHFSRDLSYGSVS
ncbi:toll-like receptor 2 [Sardina pilchardus]|uniref:toll-like receptor 2 n=1 Tax=Sardina pilchardus TaxID=27697 RepID=UPI002E0D1ABB